MEEIRALEGEEMIITPEILNYKHPIPYETVKKLEKLAYMKGYRAGRKYKPRMKPVFVIKE